VVDPGVGGARKAIAVQTANYFFVGPDNGVLSWALSGEKIRAIHALENEKYFLHPVSRTFHGRDVFAPVAAHLIRGVGIQKLGPRLKEVVRLARPVPRVRGGRIEGEVLYIDRFGNAITNIEAQMLQAPGRGRLSVLLRHKWLCPVAAFYQAVPTGRPVAVPGSSGLLEIAVSGGSAANDLGLRVGSAVQVRLRQERSQRKG
jgi:S-adenosylmethionine hydrolase